MSTIARKAGRNGVAATEGSTAAFTDNNTARSVALTCPLRICAENPLARRGDSILHTSVPPVCNCWSHAPLRPLGARKATPNAVADGKLAKPSARDFSPWSVLPEAACDGA